MRIARSQPAIESNGALFRALWEHARIEEPERVSALVSPEHPAFEQTTKRATDRRFALEARLSGLNPIGVEGLRHRLERGINRLTHVFGGSTAALTKIVADVEAAEVKLNPRRLSTRALKATLRRARADIAEALASDTRAYETLRAATLAADGMEKAERAAQLERSREALVAKQRRILSAHLPTALALIRELSVRTLGMRPYDVQLIGAHGMLAADQVVEMRTGEGKTLVTGLALALNSLLGERGHLAVPNDYLGRVHAQRIGPLYQALGLRVVVLQNPADRSGGSEQGAYLYDPGYEGPDQSFSKLRPIDRREVDEADIVVGTLPEFIFDHERRHLSNDPFDLDPDADRPDRRLLLLDEIDNALLDDGRTPVTIARPASGGISPAVYRRAAAAVVRLRSEEQDDGHPDFEYDEKTRELSLTATAMERLHEMLGLPVGADAGARALDPEELELFTAVRSVLDARVSLKAERDYITEGTKVVLLDREKSRRAEGRSFSDGLQQGLEALVRQRQLERLLRAVRRVQRDPAVETSEEVRLYADRCTGDSDAEILARLEADGEGTLVEITPATRAVASVEMLSYVRGVSRVAGTTGTSSPLLETIYDLPTLVLPTDVGFRASQGELEVRPEIFDGVLINTYVDGDGAVLYDRLDYPPELFVDDVSKMRAAREAVAEIHARGTPVLAVLQNGKEAEVMSAAMREVDLAHQVLTARNHAEEAKRVAAAGRKDRITVATTMAGRGTDILLGGDPEGVARELAEARGGRWAEYLAVAETTTAEERAEIVRPRTSVDGEKVPGGLWVVAVGGVQYRSWRQVAGRCARQGDPGASMTMLSLEDLAPFLTSGEVERALAEATDEDGRLSDATARRLIRVAREREAKRTEETLQRLRDFDEVARRQREAKNETRRSIRTCRDPAGLLLEHLEGALERLVEKHHPFADREAFRAFTEEAFSLVPQPAALRVDALERLSARGLFEALKHMARQALEDQREVLGAQALDEQIRSALLGAVEDAWSDHIVALGHLAEDAILIARTRQRDHQVEFQGLAAQGWEEFRKAAMRQAVATLRRVTRRLAPSESPSRSPG